MRHQVGDRLVAQMAYAREHGDAQCCYCPGDFILVEDQQVCLGTATSDDDHGVEGIGHRCDLVQSSDNGACVFRSLN